MKNLVIAAAIFASAAATPAIAQFSTNMNSNTASHADFDMLGKAKELAMCGVYKGLFGNCSRAADGLGLSEAEVRDLAREYWNTAPAARAEFLADLGL